MKLIIRQLNVLALVVMMLLTLSVKGQIGEDKYYVIKPSLDDGDGNAAGTNNPVQAVSFQNIPRGATMQNAINVDAALGICGGTFTDTQNNNPANGFGNEYGDSSDDIYYRFSLSVQSQVSISHCNSGFDTRVYILDANGNRLYANDDGGPICTGSLSTRASLRETLNPGTYYVVCEGYGSGYGDITTEIVLPTVSFPALNVVAGNQQATYSKYGTRMRASQGVAYETRQSEYWGGENITCSSGSSLRLSSPNADTIAAKQSAGTDTTAFKRDAGAFASSEGGSYAAAVNSSYSCRPLNRSGIWLSSYTASLYERWMGIDTDINVPMSKTYFIGYAGDDEVKVYIDGLLVGKLPQPGNVQHWENYGYWYVDPVYLSQGNHKLHLEFKGNDENVSVGVELYNNTYSELYNATNGTGVNRIFSTRFLDQSVTSFIQMNGADAKVYNFR